MDNKWKNLFLLIVILLVIDVIATLYMGIGGLFFCLIGFVLILFILLMMGFIYNNIKSDDIQIKNMGDNKIHIDYKDYQIVFDNKYVENKVIIPNVDLTGKKIDFISRYKIHDYLLKKYDSISIPSDYSQVKVENVMKYFDDFTLCDKNKKDNFVNRSNLTLVFGIIFVISFLMVLRPGVTIRDIILIMGIPSYLLLYSLYINYKRMNMLKKYNLYSKNVEIFDKRVKHVGERLHYEVRVCDSSKNVLMYWFDVSKLEYDTCNSGVLYVLANDDNACDVFFETGVYNK